MGRQFEIVLEYDGENPVRNTFLCEIDNLNYSVLRNWEDLYDSDLNKYSSKKHSQKTLELSDRFGCHSWGANNIECKIEAIKKEIELDIDLDELGKENLNEIIKDLQTLHDIVVEKCHENNVDLEKCCIIWWINV